MVVWLVVYKKREKWGTKTNPFGDSMRYHFWSFLVALWSAVVLVVRIGGVYGVTTYTGNLSSDFRILDFSSYRLLQGGRKIYFVINYD